MNTIADLLYGMRRLGNSPAFTLTSVLVIVLGLALYLCSYSLSYNFTKPLDFENGDRFVTVKTVYKDTSTDHFGNNFDGFAYNRLKEQVSSYATLGAYRFANYAISDGERSQRFVGAEIEPELLSTIGVAPLLGRLLTDEDALSDSQAAVLLSYSIWRNYYASDPEIVGRSSRINGRLYTVVGVMPESFDYPFSQHIWFPLNTSADVQPDGNLSLGLLGVLDSNVTLASASTEMSARMVQLAEEYPAYYAETEANVVRHSQTHVSTGNAGDLFQLVTLTILLLATLNLGTLLFVRANARQKELAIRYAIGANQWEISRQILLESLILCVIGFLLSLGIADFVLSLVQERLRTNFASSDYPGTLSSWIDLSMDGRAIAIATALTLFVWLSSGGFVAYRATKKDNNSVLAGGSKGGTDRSRVGLSRLIVGFEVTTSCLLLIVCCVLVAAIMSTYRLDFGTPTTGYYTGMLELKGPNYQEAEQRRDFLQNLQRELAERSETSGATLATALPGQYGYLVRYGVEDRDLRVSDQYPEQTSIWVADDYFEVLEVSLVEGRYFDESDSSSSLLVVIINERFSESLWPGQSALGKRIQINPETEGEWHTVVGVTSHIIHGNPMGNYDQNPTLYRSLNQSTPTNFSLAIKLNRPLSDIDAERLISDTVQVLDRELAVTAMRSLARVTEMSMQGMDLIAKFSIAFALGTFVLAIIGVYGNISRAVTQRTNEIGIRRALGSSNRKVLWVFLREGGLYLMWGTVIGGVSAVLISSALAGYFNNILTFLPVIVPVVITTIAALVLLASYLPARKAIAIEPGDALHYE
ncbi:MAG: hypothetical protein COB20_09885 [SAR86 cluster bacterium]|uniref:ABC transporter permease n=1 Tax=SAR86 cluster bacterium TaxID=2030880 RepID=A0A2A4X3W1_9GAMM|nr:MAG: hypothetical protein COB20_09885 [SAR86 cluster bacterium]